MSKRKHSPEEIYAQSRRHHAGRQQRGVASSVSSYQSRLDTTAAEADALEALGYYLFQFILADFDRALEGIGKNARKKAMIPDIGDRYAYGIVSANDDQIAL